MIKLLAKTLRILNSETDPYQISLALCLAMVAGFSPLMSLHNVVVFFLVFVLRVNLSTFLLSWALFSGLAYLLDPLFHVTGLAILTAGPLEGLWTALYNMPLFRIERFNNSVLMGSLLISLVLFLPLYLVTNRAIIRYRQSVLVWVRSTRVMQMIQLSKFYQAYTSFKTIGGDV